MAGATTEVTDGWVTAEAAGAGQGCTATCGVITAPGAGAAASTWAGVAATAANGRTGADDPPMTSKCDGVNGSMGGATGDGRLDAEAGWSTTTRVPAHDGNPTIISGSNTAANLNCRLCMVIIRQGGRYPSRSSATVNGQSSLLKLLFMATIWDDTAPSAGADPVLRSWRAADARQRPSTSHGPAWHKK
jgi:hypothetical protein